MYFSASLLVEFYWRNFVNRDVVILGTLPVTPKLQPVKRWTVAKKAELLDILLSYKVEVVDVLDFYPDLSADELMHWRELYQLYGRAGLRATHQKMYRAQPFLKQAA